MNIILGKIGGVGTNFGDGYNEYGGDMIARLFIDIANSHPENTYYVSSTNDMSKAFAGFNSAKKPKNLIDYYTKVRHYNKARGWKLFQGESYKMLDECLKDDGIKIDKVIILAASCSNACLWDMTYTLDGSRIRKPLMSCRNGAQIVYYVSIHQDIECDWLLDDPRIFLTYPYDLLKEPNKVASQSNETIMMPVCKGYKEASKEKKMNEIRCQYSNLEKYFLKGKKKVDWRNDERSNLFIMTLHGMRDRAIAYHNWIYKFDPTVKVYGKDWSDNAVTRKAMDCYNLPYDNFENKKISEIEDLMWNSKYTFIPSVANKYPSFVTQKVWVMLYYGIIPFWCKTMYDSTNIYSEFPDFLKVETPEEMWDKIKFLENNPEEYKKLRYQLYEVLKDEYFTTDFVLDRVNEILDNEA